ncbi:hypothetical protein Hanom_Chr16g01436131 [Helianthus anomalus]
MDWNFQLHSHCEEFTSTSVQLQAQVSEIWKGPGVVNGSTVQPLASQHFPIVTNGHQRLQVGRLGFVDDVADAKGLCC